MQRRKSEKLEGKESSLWDSIWLCKFTLWAALSVQWEELEKHLHQSRWMDWLDPQSLDISSTYQPWSRVRWRKVFIEWGQGVQLGSMAYLLGSLKMAKSIKDPVETFEIRTEWKNRISLLTGSTYQGSSFSCFATVLTNSLLKWKKIFCPVHLPEEWPPLH